MSSKSAKLPVNVADALNTTGRLTRAQSHAELFELASDGKTVLVKPKIGDKNVGKIVQSALRAQAVFSE